MTSPSSMTPAEKKATEAVARAAKRWRQYMQHFDRSNMSAAEHLLFSAVSRLLREEAKSASKRKGVRRGK